MLLYYRVPGLVACIALIVYTVFMYALFRLLGVTLTLAGIAAFILSVGMAVDANILIFERTKEELRAGKNLTAAIEAGFGRAWNSIFDSNVSTLITAFILYYFGTSVVKGFALVLIIGVLTSMFTAITLSRMMLRWVVQQPRARQAHLFGIADAELSADARSRRERGRPAVLDLVGKRRYGYIFSGILTVVGLLFLASVHPQRRPGPAVLDRVHGWHRLGGPLPMGP